MSREDLLPPLRGIIYTLACIVWLAGCERSPANAPREVSAGHRRMLELLADVRRRTPEEHRYLGDRYAREFRAELESLGPSAPDEERWRLHRLLGVQELNLGRESEALDHLRRAHELLPRVAGKIGDFYVNDTIFQLAIAYIRFGETQNCCARNTPESCIFPIRGGGIHTRPEGSKTAIGHLLRLLETPSLSADRALAARWLLNVAFMTLGSYPDAVPRKHLIPPAAFKPPDDFPRFVNVASRLGIDSFNCSGGVVVDDFDGDGQLDIFTSTWDTAGEPHLFVNNGDGSFTDRAGGAGLAGIYGGLNLVQADYDNDGDIDVFVLRGAWLGAAGRHPNSLLRNNGDLTFTDVTFESGLGDFHFPTQTAAWADYDKDGDVDLYIGNETSKDLTAPCQLYRNDGDGTFTDVTPVAGVENLRFTKGVAWGDYDGDGFPDLYVSNLGDRNRLYRNDGDGTFTDVAGRLGVDGPRESFPVWFWDFDNDGALDIFVPCYSGRVEHVAAHYLGLPPAYEPPCLYRGDGRGGFSEVAARVGLIYPMLPMGANFGDLDGDGFLDFYLGTGDPKYYNLMPNVMFLNGGGERFTNVTFAGGFGHLQKGHAVAFADLDNDGDVDVFEQMGGAYPGDRFGDALYENPGFGNDWLHVDLVGTTSNRSAIGARLRAEVVDAAGSVRSVYRHVSSGGSFGAAPLRQTIGLGKGGRIRALEILWPASGLTQRVGEVPSNRAIRIVEGRDGFSELPLKPFRFR